MPYCFANPSLLSARGDVTPTTTAFPAGMFSMWNFEANPAPIIPRRNGPENRFAPAFVVGIAIQE